MFAAEGIEKVMNQYNRTPRRRKSIDSLLPHTGSHSPEGDL